MKLQRWLAGTAVILAAGCGGGGGIGGTGGGGIDPLSGTLRVSLTDAPACGYDEVNITVEKVRVHASADAGSDDNGWSEIVLSPPQRLDLLELNNGVLVELGQAELPAGRYNQLRLVLADNGGSSPPANSVVLSDTGIETALDTPSAQQSGLKLKADIEVPAGQVVDVVLDFDACKSIVKAGRSGKFLLKPVIAVIPLLQDAGLRVTGHIDPALAVPGTTLSVQSGGVPLRATVPRADGSFSLVPVPQGSYTLVVTAAGRATAVMTGVPVVSGTPTVVSSAAVPIVPALAALAPRVVIGAVTPATATVRALQVLSAGPTIEVAYAPVDADTGAFAFVLPIDAPRTVAYVPDPASIVLGADAAAAGRYTIEAGSAGVVQTQDVDTTTPVPPLVFVFP